MSDMTTVNKRATVNLTEEQINILRDLSEAAGYNSISAYLKSLIEGAAFRAGYLWPEDENTWGGVRQPQK